MCTVTPWSISTPSLGSSSLKVRSWAVRSLFYTCELRLSNLLNVTKCRYFNESICIGHWRCVLLRTQQSRFECLHYELLWVKHVAMCFGCLHAFIQRIAKSLLGCGSRGRCRGYQSWIHSESSHAGEVALSEVISRLYTLKLPGKLTLLW